MASKSPVPQGAELTTNTNNKKTPTKELGMLVMLLAAEGVSTVTRSGASSQGPQSVSSASDLVVGGMSTDSECASMKMVATPATPSEETASDSGAALLETDEMDSKRGILAADTVIVSTIFCFLPWRKAMKHRRVNKLWKNACETNVAFVVPSAAVPTVFIRSPLPVELINENGQSAELGMETERQLKFRCPKWRCNQCAFLNTEDRLLCGNRSCQNPVPSHADTTRLFFGQLWRNDTVPFVQWVIESVIDSCESTNPDERINIVNVENHRAAKTNRGKGCAWVYFAKDGWKKCLAYHHRVFADVSRKDNCYGVCVTASGNEKAFAADVEPRAQIRTRPLFLPRNTLVVERPAQHLSIAAVAEGESVQATAANVDQQQETPNANNKKQVEKTTTKQKAKQKAGSNQHQRTPSTDGAASEGSATSTTATSARRQHNPYSYHSVEVVEQQQQQQQQAPQQQHYHQDPSCCYQYAGYGGETADYYNYHHHHQQQHYNATSSYHSGGYDHHQYPASYHHHYPSEEEASAAAYHHNDQYQHYCYYGEQQQQHAAPAPAPAASSYHTHNMEEDDGNFFFHPSQISSHAHAKHQ